MSYFCLNLGQTAEDSDMFTIIWLRPRGLTCEPVFVVNIMLRNIYWKWKPNYFEICVGREDMTVNQAVLAKKMTLRNADVNPHPLVTLRNAWSYTHPPL